MAIDETGLHRAHAASLSAELALILGKAFHGMELAPGERALLSNSAARLGGYSAQSNPRWVEELKAALELGADQEADDRLLSVLFSLGQGESFDPTVLEPVWKRFRSATKALLDASGRSGERPVKLVL